MKNVTGQHLMLLFQYILHPVSPGHVLHHLSSQCKCTLLFMSFAYERILTFFLFSLFTKLMFRKVSSEMMPSVYYHSSNPGQTFIDIFLGTF